MSELFLRQLEICQRTKDLNDYLVLCQIILSIIRNTPEQGLIKAIDYLIRKKLKQEQGLMFAYNSDNKRVLILPKFQEVI